MADLVSPSTYQQIAGGGDTAIDPMKMLTQWQQLQNMRTSNQLGQQSLESGKFDLSAKRRDYTAKQIFDVQNLGDDEIVKGAHTALDRELQAGMVDDKQYGAMKQQLEAAGGDPKKTRTIINGMMAGTLAGPEAIKFLMGDRVTVNNGAQISGGVVGGMGGANPGAITTSGPVYQQLPGPQMTNLGRSIVPTSGGVPVGPAMPVTSLENMGGYVQPVTGTNATGKPMQLTEGPDTAGRIETWQDEKGNWITGPHSQRTNQNLQAPGIRTDNLTNQGSGRYPGQGLGGNQIVQGAGQKETQAVDVENFKKDQAQVPERMQNAQNLQKALTALQTVNTGSGNEWLASGRAKAVTLMHDLGISNPRIDAQDFSQAEADKLLTDYARKSGSAANSNNQLAASEASNPSSHMNNAAAQDFVRNNIGLERQKAAAVMFQQQKDANGIGHGGNMVKFSKDTDKRGFAWDTYTPQQLTTMVKAMSPDQREKFMYSMGLAKDLKLATGEQGSPVPQQNTASQKAMGQ